MQEVVFLCGVVSAWRIGCSPALECSGHRGWFAKLQGHSCFTTVITRACRGIWAAVPGAPPAPPCPHPLVSPRCFPHIAVLTSSSSQPRKKLCLPQGFFCFLHKYIGTEQLPTAPSGPASWPSSEPSGIASAGHGRSLQQLLTAATPAGP